MHTASGATFAHDARQATAGSGGAGFLAEVYRPLTARTRFPVDIPPEALDEVRRFPWPLDPGLPAGPRYPFMLELYRKGVRHTWFPEEIPLAQDRAEYRDLLDARDRRLLDHMLGFFANAENLVSENIAWALHQRVAPPEARLFLQRQAYEEVNHAATFRYLIESLGLDREAIYALGEEVPSIRAKREFERAFTARLAGLGGALPGSPPWPAADSPAGDPIVELFRNLFGFYMILEGLFFFSGFLLGLSFGRRQVMPGLGALIRLVLRDETVHLAFGVQTMRALLSERPDLAGLAEELSTLMARAVDLESRFAEEAMPEGVIGLTPRLYRQYAEHIADRRLASLGFRKLYGTQNPARWLATQTDLPELTNFFEAHVTSYES